MSPYPESVRAVPLRGTWGYVDRISVAPGDRVTVRVSAETSHEVEIVRLGRDAVIAPEQNIVADRADVEVIGGWSHPAPARQSLTHGSYIHVGGPPVPGGPPLTLGLWVRLLTVPAIDVVQMAWQALIGDIDYPEAARFGLLVDNFGRVGAYVGDGGPFRHEWLHHTEPFLKEVVGEWIHVAATWSSSRVRIFIDGELRGDEALEVPSPRAGVASRLRIGAIAEAGAADDFLDADIAGPFVGSFELNGDGAGRLFRDRAHHPVASLGLGKLLAEWPLDEERGDSVADASGHDRHGRLVNHGTWMIGGPAFDAANRRPFEYEPADDPDRGHGLRLSSDDLVDATWPASGSAQIPGDADSGLYAARVRLPGQPVDEALVVPFVVARRVPRSSLSIALLAATNTWFAYGRRPTHDERIAGLASSCYSTHANGRPFFHVGTQLPIPYASPYLFESRRSTRTRSTHLVRTERFAEAWLAAEGYAYEVIADSDLHDDPALLSHFQALMICGHSEYWTNEMRDGVLAFLDAGGHVISLSGDTLSVRVTFDAAGVMEARKIVQDDDPRWLSPEAWGERWHSEDGRPGGSYRHLGAPSWDVLGMNFKGMIDDGTSNSFASYTVLRPDHFLFHEPAEVPITPAGTIGERSLNGSGAAGGYEFDANIDRSGLAAGPVDGVETLASALGQRNLEWIGERDHGGDIVYWARPGGGVVVNFGSVAMSGALPVDPGIAALVRNTLHHFGVGRRQGGGTEARTWAEVPA